MMTCLSDDHGPLELLEYADGSLGIWHAGGRVDVWEPCERREGMAAFLRLSGFDRGPAPGAAPDVVFLVPARDPSAASMN